MLKFLASLSSCKTILRIAEQRSVRGVNSKKRGKTERGMARP